MKPSTPYNSDHDRILRYIGGEMTDQERHDFEAEMVDNDALSDAVDGAEMLASPSKTLARLKKRTTKPSYVKWVIGIATLCALVALFFVLDNIQKPIATSAVTNVHQVEVQRIIAIPAEHNDSTFSFAINTADEPQSPINHSKAEETWRVDIEAPSKLQKKKATTVSTETEKSILRVFGKDAIYHIQNYKVVDYRKRTNDLAHETSGMPADNRAGLVPEKTKVTYIAFLEETMQFFAEHNYEKAYTGFNAILANFPDDLNAQFYGGMSALELGNYATAEMLFIQATQNSKLTFIEESKFYLASARMLKGDKNAACLDFTSIAQQGGFYAERANEELNRHCK
jgi:TolA-binding protein